MASARRSRAPSGCSRGRTLMWISITPRASRKSGTPPQRRPSFSFGYAPLPRAFTFFAGLGSGAHSYNPQCFGPRHSLVRSIWASSCALTARPSIADQQRKPPFKGIRKFRLAPDLTSADRPRTAQASLRNGKFSARSPSRASFLSTPVSTRSRDRFQTSPCSAARN
jgi:hypothetical protein